MMLSQKKTFISRQWMAKALAEARFMRGRVRALLDHAGETVPAGTAVPLAVNNITLLQNCE
jgi:hypothetical protein